MLPPNIDNIKLNTLEEISDSNTDRPSKQKQPRRQGELTPLQKFIVKSLEIIAIIDAVLIIPTTFVCLKFFISIPKTTSVFILLFYSHIITTLGIALIIFIIPLIIIKCYNNRMGQYDQ